MEGIRPPHYWNFFEDESAGKKKIAHVMRS
jgi:hypothetical protein